MMIRFFFLTGLLFLTLIVHCQHTGTLLDVFTDKSITIDGKYVRLSSDDDGPDASYPVFRGLKDSVVEKALNKRIVEIFVKQIGTDTFRAKLFRDVKNVTDTYFEVHKKTKNQLGIYSAYSFSPLIADVDYQFLSFNYPFVTFFMEVTYQTQYQQYLSEQNFTYREVYYFDVLSGKEYSRNQLFVPALTSELSQKVISKANLQLEKIDFSKYESDDEYEGDDNFYIQELINDRKSQRALCSEFSVLTHCFPYVALNDFAFHIPAFSPCTKTFYGSSAELHFSFDEVKKFVNPAGPLGFMLKIKKEVTPARNFQNLFYPAFDRPFSDIPFLEDFDRPVRDFTGKVTVKRRQLPPNSTAPDSTVKEELMRAMYYKNGKVTEITSYNSAGQTSTDVFYYSSQGNLIKKTHFSETGKIVKTEDYQYDEKNNVVLYLETASDGENESTSHSYNGTAIVTQYSSGAFLLDAKPEVRGVKYFLNDSGKIVRCVWFSERLYNEHSEYIYKYSKKGRLVAVYAVNKSPTAGSLYVYSNDGKILSYEHDNNRYFSEYLYDDKGNMIEETRYDSKRQTYSKKVQYNEKGLPIKADIYPGGGTYIQLYRFYYQ